MRRSQDENGPAVPPPDFQTLFESAPGLYLVLTPGEFVIVGASDAYLRATMTARAAILGHGIFEVFPDNPDDPAATGVRNLRASLERVRRHRIPDAMAVQKYDIRRPESEGGGFEVRYWSPVNSPVLNPDGELIYIIHRVEDVTEFVLLKEAGQERDKMAEALKIRAGQMESEIFQRSQELGEANHMLRRANSELAALYHQIALLMARAGDELRARDGQENPSDFLENPIPPAEMLARIGQLLTAHRRLEEQLRQSQKMEAVGLLAGGVAHDFNNLLTVITGYAALLRSHLPTEAASAKLDEIERAASRAASLTSQLLAFSRKQVLQPRVLDLNSVVSGMEGLLRRLIGENILLSTRLGTGLGHVWADRGQIEQVIMNLIVNARDAMPRGGKITIGTQDVHLPGPGKPAGPCIMLSVADTGHGMDAQTAGRVFEPFFTTKEPGKGTGMGLSTVYGIVQQSGGTVTVESQPLHGSEFRVYLPVIGTDVADRDSPAEVRSTASSRSGTILLVEDEAPLRGLIRTVLDSAGHRVLEAANAADALRLSSQYSATIDLLLTDVVMPGMSGPELAEQLKTNRNGMPILFMSGYDRNLIDEKALAEASFLPKPFRPETLISKIADLLMRSDVGVKRPGCRLELPDSP